MRTVDKLRHKIKDALQNVSKANSPNIYARIFNKNGKLNVRGYNQIERKVINKTVNETFTISSAIPQIEMELDLR